MAYEDKPHNYEAWDINIYYAEKSWPVHGMEDISVIEDNEDRVGVQFTRRYLETTIVERLYLERDHALVTMEFDVDWHETNQLLKLHFPYDIFTHEATFDIQYGNLTRPIHSNTSWDMARFEVAMQKWMTVHEQNFGLSILNDCKYGASVKPGDIGLSLLKSPRYPSEVADIGKHHFTYAIMPYQGAFEESDTIAKAYHLNNPPQVYVKHTTKGDLPKQQGFVYAAEAGLTIETVKKSEEGDGTIVRVYEHNGARHQTAQLIFGKPIRSIHEVDLIENDVDDGKLEISDDRFTATFQIEPYEIKSYRVEFAWVWVAYVLVCISLSCLRFGFS